MNNRNMNNRDMNNRDMNNRDIRAMGGQNLGRIVGQNNFELNEAGGWRRARHVLAISKQRTADGF